MKKVQKKIQKDYDLIARDYANKRSRPGEKMQMAVPYLKKGMRILDLGCGPGKFLELMPNGVECIGLDFSQKLLLIARKNYPETEFVYGDMTNEKVWQKLGKFDAVFAFACFHHLITKRDQQKTTKFIYEHLKDNGALMIVVWNLWQERYKKYRKKNKKQLIIPWHLSDGKKIVKSINRKCYVFEPEELKKLIEEQGFKVDKEFFTHGKNLSDAKEFGVIAKKAADC